MKLLEVCPFVYEAFVEAKIAVVMGAMPEAGGLDDQPVWFASVVRWLAWRGILEGPLRGL